MFWEHSPKLGSSPSGICERQTLACWALLGTINFPRCPVLTQQQPGDARGVGRDFAEIRRGVGTAPGYRT